MNRRNFLQLGATALSASAAPPPAPAAKMFGIQVGAVSFVDEGVEKVLDTFQREASINTLFIATFTYGRGIAGRQVPGQPLPDHGKQEYDNGSGFGTFQGGSYTRIHPQYYKDTVIQDFRAPDFGDYDVLEAVLPSARKARHEDHLLVRRRLEPARAQHPRRRRRSTLDGSNAVTLCFNNPNYRNWLLGTVEDYARSYDIDGIMWGSERQGAFANVLGAATAARHATRRRHLLLRVLRAQGAASAASTPRARARVSSAGDFRPGRAPAPAAGGWLLCHGLAPDAALPGTAGLGNAVDRQPARNLRRHVHKVKQIKPGLGDRLAHLAQQFLQPDLPRRAGP